MKNKKETKTLENNLSNNAMMMDHVLGSAANPFKNKREEQKRQPSIPDNERNDVERERVWNENEEENK